MRGLRLGQLPLAAVKKFLTFISYLPVSLVGLLGAYIVFHMWHLTEIGHRHSPQRQATSTNQRSVNAGQGLAPVKGNRSPEVSRTAADH